MEQKTKINCIGTFLWLSVSIVFFIILIQHNKEKPPKKKQNKEMFYFKLSQEEIERLVEIRE